MNELSQEKFIELYEAISNVFETSIDVPNVYETPYVIVPTLLNTQQYFFEYKWNNRHEKVYLSIFRIEDSERVYYAKDVCLIKDIYISDKIRQNDFQGILQFINQENVYDDFYTLKDFSEKFKIEYTYRTD